MRILKFILSSFLLISVSMLTISCGDDSPMVPVEEVDENVRANDKIEGEWRVTSLRIDGTEYIGWLFQKVTMEFDPDKDAASGETTWEYIDDDGSVSIEDFTYVIKNDGEDIVLEGSSFDLKVTSSSLEMEGNLDGYYYEIRAE